MNINRSQYVEDIARGQLVHEGLIMPTDDAAAIGEATNTFLDDSAALPGHAYYLENGIERTEYLEWFDRFTLSDTIKPPKELTELVDEHKDIQLKIAKGAGVTVTGTTVELNRQLQGLSHLYHRDAGNNITTATTVKGEANLNQLFRKPTPLYPGSSFTIFNGSKDKQRPIHGIYHPTHLRISVVVRTFFSD